MIYYIKKVSQTDASIGSTKISDIDSDKLSLFYHVENPRTYLMANYLY